MAFFTKSLRVVFLLAFLFSVSYTSWAIETKPRCLQSIDFLTGYATGNLKAKRDYDFTPLFVGLNFTLKPALGKINFKYPGLLQFVLEPFISYVYSPDNNMEFGNNFLIKIGVLPETSKFQPYVKGGVGVVYITQHSLAQSTQFNFNEYGGAGMHYFFKKNMAVTLEYRFRHLSNAGMRKPNSGINSQFALCGFTINF